MTFDDVDLIFDRSCVPPSMREGYLKVVLNRLPSTCNEKQWVNLLQSAERTKVNFSFSRR